MTFSPLIILINKDNEPYILYITMNAVEGKIIVYYGKGEGKTTASIGHVIRTLGHNKRVVILQFMKGRPTTGEHQFLKNLDNLQIHLCGAPVFLKDKESRKIHLKKAKEGLELAHRMLDEKKTDLLVLDEILYAVKFELLTEDDVLELLKKRGHTDIILSGREPGDRIIEMADIATHMEKVKHYWDKTGSTTSGIEY
jgi:cob(I)alamin adenosyltransferase